MVTRLASSFWAESDNLFKTHSPSGCQTSNPVKASDDSANTGKSANDYGGRQSVRTKSACWHDSSVILISRCRWSTTDHRQLDNGHPAPCKWLLNMGPAGWGANGSNHCRVGQSTDNAGDSLSQIMAGRGQYHGHEDAGGAAAPGSARDF